MKKPLLKSVVVRKIAETFHQPVNEMTDRIALNALIQHYADIEAKEINSLDNRAYLNAITDGAACKARLKYLNRLIVTSPPVTPQLNLF